MRGIMVKELYLSFMVAGIVLSLCGCVHKGISSMSAMDSYEHHYHTGCKLLEQARYDDALDEFKKSEQLSPRYAPAGIGIGLALAGSGKFEDGLAAFRKARKMAVSDREQFLYHTGMIRFYTMQKGPGWIDKAEDHFHSAHKIDANDPALFFYMARACKEAGEYSEAAGYYAKVLSIGKDYLEQSNNEWEETQKIERSIPGTTAGKRIAGLQSITRADTAALFVEELGLEDLIPPDVRGRQLTTVKSPNDFESHALRKDIEAVIGMGIRGLEPDGPRFFPDANVSRSDFAVIVEDVLVRATGENDIPSCYIGSPSPFRDVDKSSYAYNAIITCSTRGILVSGIDGCFLPNKGVSGVDALLAVRKLKGIIGSGKGVGLQ